MGLIAIVADDHALFRHAATALLRSHCDVAEVFEAATLGEAEDILGAFPKVDLAVFDLSMPGMASPGSLQPLRDRFPQTKLALLTGCTERRQIFRALEAGVHGYIFKASHPETIAAALRQILKGDVYIPANVTVLDASEPAGREPIVVHDPLKKLTPRQREVLHHLSTGKKSNKQIARTLGLAESTVKVHANAVYRAFEVHDRQGIRALVDGAASRAALRSGFEPDGLHREHGRLGVPA